MMLPSSHTTLTDPLPGPLPGSTHLGEVATQVTRKQICMTGSPTLEQTSRTTGRGISTSAHDSMTKTKLTCCNQLENWGKAHFLEYSFYNYMEETVKTSQYM